MRPSSPAPTAHPLNPARTHATPVSRPHAAVRALDDHVPGSRVHRGRRPRDAARPWTVRLAVGVGARDLRPLVRPVRDSVGFARRSDRPPEGAHAHRDLVVRVHLAHGARDQLPRPAVHAVRLRGRARPARIRTARRASPAGSRWPSAVARTARCGRPAVSAGPSPR